MTRRDEGDGASVWIGDTAEGREMFEGGQLWIGQHAGDQDILVFDPSEADADASVIALYSLTQHRMRSFPRATVLERIHPLSDELRRARAKKDYLQRTTLRSAHDQALATAHSDQRIRQRDDVISAHRRYIEAQGLAYQGVHESRTPLRPPKRVPKCSTCGIVLDDFAGVTCAICSAVLCSCGACACHSALPEE